MIPLRSVATPVENVKHAPLRRGERDVTQRVSQRAPQSGETEPQDSKQEATITEMKSPGSPQQKGLQTVAARLEQQAAEIQKVSVQLEAREPAPQVVNISEATPAPQQQRYHN
jgi:hypothetical protein